MLTQNYPIEYWDAPDINETGETIEQFLAQFQGPTWIYFPGIDSSRCRIVTTLLHGNEPSGLHAIHQWILSSEKPATDLYCFVGSVQAAQHPPGFKCRMLPGRRDLNRCFRPPFNDEEGLVAADLLRRISSVHPEAVLDIHNTSGAGPSFAICTQLTDQHVALVSLFTDKLIITELRLGALMEYEGGDFPFVTIECGGAHDPRAHQIAWNGLRQFARKPELFNEKRAQEIDLYRHPVRAELIQDAELAFAPAAVPGKDLTLHADLESYNFGVVKAGTELGWLGPQGLASLVIRDTLGTDHTLHFFQARNDCLVTRQDIRLFMITTNVPIALSDCLFYIVAAEDAAKTNGSA